MDWIVETAAVVGLFVLRIGIPIAATFAVAYGLKRLDNRWQREAQLRSGSVADSIASNCQYAGETSVACWVARRQAEGRLAAECRGCSQFALRKVA